MPFTQLTKDTHYWTKGCVDKGGYLLSGEDYYFAFREAVQQADHYVALLAWDLMSNIDMIRSEERKDGYATKLIDFLYEIVDEKPELHIYLLLWDYSVVYVGEREWVPFTRFRNEPHPRIHLFKDNAINMGASHHQKAVAIDGSFAFGGGIDLSAWRWDTIDHIPGDERRVTPQGESYQPYQDVHYAITGEGARCLDQLCRDRWERATGDPAPWRAPVETNSIWPASVSVNFEKSDAWFALTYSEYHEFPALQQIEALHLAVIAQAKDYIYIENQYLSSTVIAEALMEKLQEPDGPELILVITQSTGGILEEGTMGLMRARLLERLSDADTHHRLGAYYPHVSDGEGTDEQVYVHSKLVIADDQVVLIGSANLSNRSMKVDSEVMMALGIDEPEASAPKLLRQLIAVHMRCSYETVDEALDEADSINAAIQTLRKDRLHQLRDLEYVECGPIRQTIADRQIVDPDDPIDPGYWLQKSLAPNLPAKERRHWRLLLKHIVLIGALIAFGLLVTWAWGAFIDREIVDRYLLMIENSGWGLPILFACFLVAGLVGFSLNILLVSGTLLLGGWVTFTAAVSGGLVSAIIGFYLGATIGERIVKRFFAQYITEFQKFTDRRGIVSVALIRIFPIAPFIIINLLAGISKLSLRNYTLGTILGMVPGMASVTLITAQAQSAYVAPSPLSISLLAIFIVATVAMLYGFRKFLR